MRYLFYAFFFWTVLIAPAANAALDMSVSRSVVPEGETFQIYIRAPQNAGNVDFSPLYKDFNVVGQRKSFQTQFINGKTTQSSEIVLTVVPKTTGKLTVPALSAGKESSAPVEITVLSAEESLAAAGTSQSENGEQSAGTQKIDAPKVFLRAALSNENPIEKTPVVYTLSLFMSPDVVNGNVTAPQSKEFDLRKIGDERSYETKVNDVPYRVTEYKFSLTPLRSGKIDVPAASFTGTVAESDPFDKMMNGDFFDTDAFLMRPMRLPSMLTGRAVSVNSPALILNASPRPAGVQGDFLPAQKVVLSETYSPDAQNASVGDAITRTVTLAAAGTTDSSLPDIVFPDADGYKQYPEKPESKTVFQGDLPVAKQTRQTVFVLSKAGKVVLPALQVPWYDTVSKSVKYASLPERTLTVAGTALSPAAPQSIAPQAAAQQSSASVQPQSASENPVLQDESAAPFAASAVAKTEALPVSEPAASAKTNALLFGAGILIGGALVAIVWLVARLRARVGEDEKIKKSVLTLRRLTNDLKNACLKSDPHAARDALKALAAFYWPDKREFSLTEMAARVGSAEFSDEIDALNEVLYGHDADVWNGEALFAAFNDVKDEIPLSAAQDGEEVVPPLYPV